MFGSADSAPVRMEPVMLLRCPFFPTITAPTNGNCLFCQIPQGNHSPAGQSRWKCGQMWASLWLWLRGPEQETRTLCSQMECKMDAEWCRSLGRSSRWPEAAASFHRILGMHWECSSSLLLTPTSESQMFPANAPKTAESGSGSHPPFGASVSSFSLLFLF